MTIRSKVGQEIKQGVPFRTRAQEALIGLHRTVDMTAERFARVVGPRGLTAQQYNVLRILRGAGPDGLQTLAITGRMIERAPGITRLLDRLEAKGLVSRNRRNDDRRCVVCRITNKGLALLAELDDPVTEAEVRMLSALPERDQKELIRLLDEIRDGLREP
jgi:DNA-binding MarR family transcriptional regulator